MRLAVSLNVGHGHEPYDALNHTYVTFLQRIGIEPLLVPNSIRDPRAFVAGYNVQGVVLTGGNDVSPHLYGGQSTSSSSVSDRRDDVETELLSMALEARLPVLGICRGMQFINVFFGGALQGLGSDRGSVGSHVGRPHANVCVDSTVGRHCGHERFTVNSFHNQGITTDTLAPCLTVFAVSQADELVEGIMHPVHPVLGIQWHPERPGGSVDYDDRLMDAFFRRLFWN